MLILSRIEVETLLDLDELIEALAAAMMQLSAGAASAPDRVGVRVPERVQDAAAAALVLGSARRNGAGTQIEL